MTNLGSGKKAETTQQQHCNRGGCCSSSLAFNKDRSAEGIGFGSSEEKRADFGEEIEKRIPKYSGGALLIANISSE